MAWLAPMTAVANEPFAASQFNTYVRDNLMHLKTLADSTEAYAEDNRVWTRIGSVSVSFSNQDAHTQTVPFGFTFPSAPRVFLNIRNASAAAARWDARADVLDVDSFRLFVYSNQAGSTSSWPGVTVDWLAVYRP